MAKRAEYWKVAPETYKAFGAVKQSIADSGLEHDLIHMVYLRVSQINGCAYCVDLHWRDAIEAGVEARKLNSVITWDECPFFTPRERAAFAWTDALTDIAASRAPDDIYAAAVAEFGESGLANLSYAIGLMNAFNRLGVGFRMQPAALDGEIRGDAKNAAA